MSQVRTVMVHLSPLLHKLNISKTQDPCPLRSLVSWSHQIFTRSHCKKDCLYHQPCHCLLPPCGGHFNICFSTNMGKVFCFLFDPSSFRYPLHCSVSRKHTFLSSSNLGSGQLFALKVCATYETVAQTNPSTISSLLFAEKVPNLIACANADTNMFLWYPSHPSKKYVLSKPMLCKNVHHNFHVLACLDFVVLTVAPAQALAAVLM